MEGGRFGVEEGRKRAAQYEWLSRDDPNKILV
jgi:hypothetical protein